MYGGKVPKAMLIQPMDTTTHVEFRECERRAIHSHLLLFYFLHVALGVCTSCWQMQKQIASMVLQNTMLNSTRLPTPTICTRSRRTTLSLLFQDLTRGDRQLLCTPFSVKAYRSTPIDALCTLGEDFIEAFLANVTDCIKHRLWEVPVRLHLWHQSCS